jgi:hypothetical protein
MLNAEMYSLQCFSALLHSPDAPLQKGRQLVAKTLSSLYLLTANDMVSFVL